MATPHVLNAAIVGLGRWGKNLVESVQGKSAGIRFVRGMVRHPEAVADFAGRHGLVLTPRFQDLLDDDAVEALVLATPHGLHVEQIVAAAQAGKPVFCEKPLALSRIEAERAVEACARAGVVLGVGHDKRFWPSMMELKRVVDSGCLGTLLHVEGNLSNENSRTAYTAWRGLPSESPGGCLTATGIHILDAFVNLLGPARQVTAHYQLRQRAPDCVDTTTVYFEFQGGASGVLTSVRPTPVFFRVHVFGTNGSAEARGADDMELRLSGKPAERRSFAPVDALRYELEAFADAVAGRAAYPVTPQQIIETVATLEAAIRAVGTASQPTAGAEHVSLLARPLDRQ
ncbi:hypothetical protein GCM10023144_25480 [Pigmentiphaga soli]|uniref:Gfo/Idh/MocA family oxidoreductase n=2 Tax=Pigmentiphaga soli TaxID=1007095 RepID=A0ABP8H3C1_9BURK